jgi:16S rRNA (guanine(527)-N(7))-methyltransferase RsmG
MNAASSLTALEIQAVLRECALNVSAGLAEAVRLYLALLLKWNQRANLTALDQPAVLLKTLFAESFYAATLLEPADGPVLDVGSGAGFPGMAMHLYRPELPMILLEPRKKRAAFLAAVRRELGLSAVTIWSRRLDECRSDDFTDPPTVVTMRALGGAAGLLRQAWPLLASPRKVLLFLSRRQVAGILKDWPELSWRLAPTSWNPRHVVLLGQGQRAMFHVEHLPLQ